MQLLFGNIEGAVRSMKMISAFAPGAITPSSPSLWRAFAAFLVAVSTTNVAGAVTDDLWIPL